MKSPKSATQTEFGDFQTPYPLAKQVCKTLSSLGISPHTIVEPTCGKGNFVLASLETFSSIEHAYGIEINKQYLSSLGNVLDDSRVQLLHEDFYNINWEKLLCESSQPILFIGNPPWVTNSQLSRLNSANLPEKSSAYTESGFAALTGQSNFDISEWMLIELIKYVHKHAGAVAMLCKTSVARKVIRHIWKTYRTVGKSRIFQIDAAREFGVSVDACLFVYDNNEVDDKTCEVFENLTAQQALSTFGYINGTLVSDVLLYNKWKFLKSLAKPQEFIWRSGVKHDCSRVVELQSTGDDYLNKLGTLISIEPVYVYPLLKSSDLANRRSPSRYLIVTQSKIGEDTSTIATRAPKTWEYLEQHKAYFTKRKSAIYRNQPDYAIFGIGDYTFSDWKIAISGLYKKLQFEVVGPHNGKPVVFDDTCYFMVCENEAQAWFLHDMLNTQPALEFFSSLIFWDNKRPITAKILNQLDIPTLVEYIRELDGVSSKELIYAKLPSHQMRLFEDSDPYKVDNTE